MMTRQPSLETSRAAESISEGWDMAWAIPKYSRTRVDVAGDALINTFSPKVRAGIDFNLDDEDAMAEWDEFLTEMEEARTVINNWRSSHSYPLNHFQLSLRAKVRDLKSPWIVAQRIKRLPAIALKLRLNKNMKLSQMQDIGGC